MKVYRILPLIAIFIAGCRGCNNEADKTITTEKKDSAVNVTPDTPNQIRDTGTTQTSPAKESATPGQPSAVQPRSVEKPSKDPGVLAKIDQYLVSTPKFTPGPNGGISQGTITVKNNLSSASFQSAILEVNILNADNSLVSSDYYTVINIEPGESKQVNIRDSPKGSKIIVHVVKVKSNELTNGESVMTGIHYKLD